MLQFFVAQREDGVACAAELERADALEVFALHEDFAARELIDALAREHRSAMGVWGDAGFRIVDVRECGGVQGRERHAEAR